MKKSEKRGIAISLIFAILGLIGIIYTFIIKEKLADTYTINAMYTRGIEYFVIGIGLCIYFIRLSKNKKKSQEQQNIYDDERIINNKNKAYAITCKIIALVSVIMEFVVTFFLRKYYTILDFLNLFIGFMIITYLIVYYWVSKNN